MKAKALMESFADAMTALGAEIDNPEFADLVNTGVGVVYDDVIDDDKDIEDVSEYFVIDPDEMPKPGSREDWQMSDDTAKEFETVLDSIPENDAEREYLNDIGSEPINSPADVEQFISEIRNVVASTMQGYNAYVSSKGSLSEAIRFLDDSSVLCNLMREGELAQTAKTYANAIEQKFDLSGDTPESQKLVNALVNKFIKNDGFRNTVLRPAQKISDKGGVL